MVYDSPQERIRALLKAHPKGLTIEEVSRQLALNRATAGKYLNSLVQSGQADLRELGRAKLFSFNKRIPLSYIINLFSDLILIIDKDQFVIDANTSLQAWFGISKEDLVKKRLNQTPLNSCLTEAFYSVFSRTLEGTESIHEVSLEKSEVVWYFRARFIPLVLEEGDQGVVILFEDITGIKQNQFDLEDRVRERTEALAAANAKLIKNIGEHKRTLAALRESEAKYRRIIETANEGIWIGDPSFTVVACNQKFAEIFGLSHTEDVIGKSLEEFVFPEDLPDHFARIVRRTHGIKEAYERRFRYKDGSERWVMVSAVPLMNPEGTYGGSFAMLTDITAQKRLEKNLEQKSRYYERLLQTSTDALNVVDKAGNLREWNPAFLSLLGYTEEEASRLHITDWVASGDHDSVMNLIRTSRAGERIQFEMRYRTKNGSILDVEISGTRVCITGEEMFYASARDITERKKTERALKDRTKWIQGITACVGGMIWETDENGLYRHCSTTVESILGYTPDEIVGIQHYYDFFPPEERESIKAAAEKAFASRVPFRAFRNRIVRKDGSVLALETNAVPLFTPDGTFSGYCGIDLVVSEEKRETPVRKTNFKQSPSRNRARVKKEG